MQHLLVKVTLFHSDEQIKPCTKMQHCYCQWISRCLNWDLIGCQSNVEGCCLVVVFEEVGRSVCL